MYYYLFKVLYAFTLIKNIMYFHFLICLQKIKIFTTKNKNLITYIDTLINKKY